jgi:hypothetical protein
MVEVIDFNGFLRWCAKPHEGLPWLKPRYGQAFFNNLSSAKPGLAEQLRGHALNPFYRDEVDPHILEWVERNWEQPLDSLLPVD